MFIRLMIFIFALNIFSPTKIVVACEMMSDHNMLSIAHDRMNHSVISAPQSHDEYTDNTKNKTAKVHKCDSFCCVTSCLNSLQLIGIDNLKIVNNKDIIIFPSTYLSSIHKVFLPRETRPPRITLF